MVIGIDASRANKTERTGTEWYSYHVIQQLKAIVPADVTVRLYTREPLRGALAELPPNWEERVLAWPPTYLWTLLRLSLEMWLHPPDVLFVPAHGLPLVLPKRTVVTIHDIGFMRFSKLYKWRQVIYHRYVVRRALRQVAAIITVSEFSKKELELVFHPRVTPVVIPLAHDRAAYHAAIPAEAVASVKNRYQLTLPYFIVVGRRERKKNIERIVASFAEFKKIDTQGYALVLIGLEGYGWAEAKARINRAGCQTAVKVLQWVPEGDMSALLVGARALVFPSLYEGFGLPILEAMAVGTPVITSDKGAPREVAGKAALLIDPRSVESLVDAMKKIATDEIFLETLRQAGFKHAAGFSWHKTAEVTWQVLSSTS